MNTPRPLASLHRALLAPARVLLRRLLGKPKHPDWAFPYAITVELLSALAPLIMRSDPPALGRRLSALLPTPLGDVTVRKASLGQLHGEWLESGASSGTVLYLHGGGFTSGSPEMVRFITSGLARRGLRVFALDYRLAPEHRYPAALDDAVSAYMALIEDGTPAQQIVIAGDSAGGQLALALALRLRDEGKPRPAAALLISPVADMRCSSPSYTENAAYDFLDHELILSCCRDYAGSADALHPYLSPVFADFSDLPPMLIHAGELEVLRDDAINVAAEIRSANGEVELVVWPGEVHDFQLILHHPPASTAIAQLAEFALQATSS